uniref:Uncharacterized protein n=1 Tax=viral metagenome TaxID=1070528 RepID=A0A6C0JS92_9ZZZZ
MSKLLENKQIIHIATEIVALIGIIFYFSSKNKKLLEHIEDLSQRLEDQEDLIQKHEQIIRQLVQAVNNRGHPPSPSSQPSKPKHVKRKKTPSPPKRPLARPQRQPDKPHVSFEDNEEVEETYEPQPVKSAAVVEEYSSDEDSDLDAEIADELEELQEQDGLKKRN